MPAPTKNSKPIYIALIDYVIKQIKNRENETK